MRHDRAQIGEQAERLAQLQQSLFGPHLGVRIGPLRTADGARAAPRRRVDTDPAWRPAAPRRWRRWRRRRAAPIRIERSGRSARAIAPSARTASAVTSAPMPSPGEDGDQRLQWGPVCVADAPARGFVALDLGQLAAQIAELVDPVQQAMARERLDRESDGDAGGQREPRGLEIDVHLRAGMLEQPGRRRLVHRHRHEPVLQGIAAEDVGDLGADDGANSVVDQRPGRMLARGAAAEVAARHQHLQPRAAVADSG